MEEKVTVLLPAHNSESTIVLAIKSILSQTYRNIELWVLENGSTDQTLTIVKGIADARVKVFELGPVGFQNALTFGINQAQTELIARMDADDIALPNRIQTQVEVMHSLPQIAFCGTAYYYLMPSGHVLDIQSDLKAKDRYVSLESFMPGIGDKKRYFADPSTMFRKSCVIATGLYDEEFPIGDVGMWLKLLQKYNGYELAEPLLVYRVNQKSMSTDKAFWEKGMRLRKKYIPKIATEIDSHKYYPHDINLWVAKQEFLAGEYNTALNYIKLASNYHTGKLSKLESRLKWKWFYRFIQRNIKNQVTDRRLDIEALIKKYANK